MPVSLPYLPSNKNLDPLFTTIQSAKVPDRFTQEFLSTTVGLKGSNDRAMIPLLRTLGFIDQSGAPTSTYRHLKNPDSARAALATGTRAAYKPLFEANENAHSLPADKLKGLVSQVAGTDDTMTARIVSTFGALCKLADFSAQLTDPKDEQESADIDTSMKDTWKERAAGGKGLSPQFHYNIQIHLPSNATEDVYLNIFNALRKVF
jgi:hypothetical protein